MHTDPFANQSILRTTTLLDNGWSKYRIAQAIKGGELTRPRKGWVARANTNPALLFAAHHGVLLACVTQAELLGLWAQPEHKKHLAVRKPGAEIRPPDTVLHWRKPLVPRHPDALADPIENVLDHVAHCQPFEIAVAIWDSALNKRLVEHAVLTRLPLIGISRKGCAAANRFADSGLESYVRLRLDWLRVKIIAQAWVLGHRVDFLLGSRLILQIDGGHHVGAQRTSDIRHDAELMLNGYTVIRVGYAQVMGQWPEVQALIMRAIAQGAHLEK